MADFNGDSRPDLAMTRFDQDGKGKVSVLLQSSTDDGVFESGVDYQVGDWPESVEVDDLNGNNWPDLLIANYASDSVSALFNDPAQAGIFQSEVIFSTGHHPDGFAIGDLNDDGMEDIAAGGSYLVLLFNNPVNPGDFYTGSTLTYQPYFISVAIADFNSDGRNDLATTGNGKVTVFLQEAAPLVPGSFFNAASYLAGLQPTAIGDLNDDGAPDLDVANSADGSVSVLHQSAMPGVFLPCSNLKAGQPLGVAIVDLDEDGLNDIVVADDGARIYFQNPAAPGTFLP